MTRSVHIIPLSDSMPHRNSQSCWCGPKTKEVEGGTIAAHVRLNKEEVSENDYLRAESVIARGFANQQVQT